MGEASRAKLLTAQDDSAYVSPDLEGAIDRVKLPGLSLLLVRVNVVELNLKRSSHSMGLFGPSYHRLCEKGIKAFESGDLEAASDLFMKAIKKEPQQPRAFGWLGMTYQQAVDQFALREEQTSVT